MLRCIPPTGGEGDSKQFVISRLGIQVLSPAFQVPELLEVECVSRLKAPGRKRCLEGWQSGQMQRAVNSSTSASTEVRILPPPVNSGT